MNKKQIIRLTESQFHQIVKESVNNVLNELDWKTYQNAKKKASAKGDYERAGKFARASAAAFGRDYIGEPKKWKDGNMERSVEGFMDYDAALNPQINGWLSTSVNGSYPSSSHHTRYRGFENTFDIENEVYDLACDLADKGMEYEDAWDKAVKQISAKYPSIKWDKDGHIKSNYRLKPKSGLNMSNLVDSELTNAYDEFDAYLNGDYEYQKGNGWVKKEDN